jgi:hypothetical protein
MPIDPDAAISLHQAGGLTDHRGLGRSTPSQPNLSASLAFSIKTVGTPTMV